MAHINPRLDPQATKIRNITRSTLSCKSTARYGAKQNKRHGNRRVRRKMDSKLLTAQLRGCTCFDLFDDEVCAICDFNFDRNDQDFGFAPRAWGDMVQWRRDHETLSMAIRWSKFHRAGKDDDEWITFISQAFPKDLIGRHAVSHIFGCSRIDMQLWKHLV